MTANRSITVIHFVRFNVVGVIGFVLQASALFVLTHSPYRVGYLVATVTAVELAVLHNFVWHQFWTWKDRPSTTIGEALRRLLRFNITNGAVSLVGNLICMSFLVGVVRLPIVVANILSVIACSICNFLLADRIAFVIAKVDGATVAEPV